MLIFLFEFNQYKESEEHSIFVADVFILAFKKDITKCYTFAFPFSFTFKFKFFNQFNQFSSVFTFILTSKLKFYLC